MTDSNPGNWWQRNWKWFVPVGCLTSLLILAGGITLILALAFSLIREADVYGMALDRARSHHAVIAALGEPIEEGWMPGGSIEVSGPRGDAALSIPVSGPRGAATIHLEAHKAAGTWQFTSLVVALDADGRRIDLLAGDDEMEEE